MRGITGLVFALERTRYERKMKIAWTIVAAGIGIAFLGIVIIIYGACV